MNLLRSRRHLALFTLFALACATLGCATPGRAEAPPADPARPQIFLEDFGRSTTDSTVISGWQNDNDHFTLAGQGAERHLEAESAEARGHMIWKSVPIGRVISCEAVVTPRRTLGDHWKTAGLGLGWNEDNYWDLALVEAPAAQNNLHAMELSETLHGTRNANGTGENLLHVLESSGTSSWEFDKPYRLRISLTADRVAGDVYEGQGPDGKLLFHVVLGLKDGAVAQGRPMIEAAGFTIAVADLKAQVSETGTEPQPPLPVYPPFVSAPAPAGLPQFAASGSFRTVNQGTIWWLVDPRGRATLAIGTDHTNYNAHFCKKLNYSPYHKNVSQLYPDEAAWATSATERLKQWNFNMLGDGHSPSTRYHGLAHTQLCSFGADFSKVAALVPKGSWTGFPDVFDPRWPSFCDRRARELCMPESSDPWLVGYFIDNELEWGGKSREVAGLAKAAWTLPSGSAGKRALVESLRGSYQGSIRDLNADFGTNFQEFDELCANTAPTTVHTARGIGALKAFGDEVARLYFTAAAAAIRAADPNHMVLGCRFATALNLPAGAYRWCAATCDVASLNLYPRIDLETGASPETDKRLEDAFAAMHKPIMITEWSFPGLDARDSAGRPLPSQHGAGMRVDTQTQRARAYTLMQHRLFSAPYIVGSDYFMWVDEPALGFTDTFLEDSNYGLVDDSDHAYPELIAAAQSANAGAYQLHAGVTAELGARVVRGGILVANSGAVAATFDLAQWRDGARNDSELTLAPGASKLLDAPKGVPGSAIYWRVQCDPDGKVVEANQTNNSAALLIRTPDGARETRPGALAVWNPTGGTLSQVPVAWPGGGTTATVPQLGPYAAVTLRAGQMVAQIAAPLAGPPQVRFARQEGGYSVETDKLRLSKSGGDGAAFDHIALKTSAAGEPERWSEMGGFTPLIFQVVEGHNVWARPTRVTQVKVKESSPARLVLDVSFESDPQGAAYPGSRAIPAAYRCAYRLTFLVGTPYFLSQVLWLENDDTRPWNLHAYYHFLLPAPDADPVLSVPNLWRQIGLWRVAAGKLVFGALPTDPGDDILIQFHKDTSLHSDCRREFDLDLAPGQIWQPATPEPEVAIFGLPTSEADPKPWERLEGAMRAQAAVKTALVDGVE